MESDKEDLVEFLDHEKRGNSNFVVINSSEVIGFFHFNKVADRTIDIGLGMRPDLTDNGNGLELFTGWFKFREIKI